MITRQQLEDIQRDLSLYDQYRAKLDILKRRGPNTDGSIPTKIGHSMEYMNLDYESIICLIEAEVMGRKATLRIAGLDLSEDT